MYFILLSLFLSVLFSQGKVDGTVAIVGDNIILHSDVLQQAQILAARQKIDPARSPYLFKDIYSKTLNNIVNQYIVLSVAEKDTNIIISNNEVDIALEKHMEDLILQAGSKELIEEALGLTLRKIKLDYWHEIRNMMFIERYKFSKIQRVNVSRIEVNNFYEIYKDSILIIPENYTFSVVEVPFVSGQSSEVEIYNILDSIRTLIMVSGASFDSLAKIYSQDSATSLTGGNLGYTVRGSLVHAYEEAAFALIPGEISVPIRTQFGYHLIRLLHKKGEKISSQHILLFVPFSNADKKNTFDKVELIYKKTKGDPFVFDSLAIEYRNIYNNLSGKFSSLSPKEIPQIILNYLLSSSNNFSSPIETKKGYALIYLYKHNKEYVPNLINSWNLIYEYALQEKQNRVFLNLVDKLKEETYIRILNEY